MINCECRESSLGLAGWEASMQATVQCDLIITIQSLSKTTKQYTQGHTGLLRLYFHRSQQQQQQGQSPSTSWSLQRSWLINKTPHPTERQKHVLTVFTPPWWILRIKNMKMWMICPCSNLLPSFYLWYISDLSATGTHRTIITWNNKLWQIKSMMRTSWLVNV